MKIKVLKMALEVIELLEDITMLNIEIARCNRMIVEALSHPQTLVGDDGTDQAGGAE